MKRIYKFFCLIILFLVAASHGTYVAVLETMADNKESLTLSERQYLTNILREQAVKTLPASDGFTIMTRENINMMLPPGKSIEDCEGSCLAETGKNIAADYVAQARVGQFGTSLSISVELYETATSKLVSSFNGRGDDIVALEQEIIQKSAELFGFVTKAATKASEVLVAGSYMLSVTTNPEQVSLYVDGQPSAQCATTPCRVQVSGGKHVLTFEKELYDELDTVIQVLDNMEIFIPMSPNYGSVEISPKLQVDIGSINDVVVRVDEKITETGAFNLKLKPGIHNFELTHPCYDPVKFKVGVGKGSSEFVEKEMVPATGGLSLNVERDGLKQNVPVYVDGKVVGKSPYLGDVSVCSKIAVGDGAKKSDVPVVLKPGDVVNYTHKLASMRATPKPASSKTKSKSGSSNKKKLWMGAAFGVSYNDFYDTKLGFGNLSGDYGDYSLSTQGEDDLLGSYWGVGGNLGLGILYLLNPSLGIHIDISAAFRQGSGKSDVSVILKWNESSAKPEKSDMEIETENYQVNVDVPLLLRYAIPGKAYFEAGPMVSFNLLGNSKVTIRDIYGEESFEDDNFKSFEFDAAVGLGITRYLGKSMLDLGTRFVLGLTRISDGDDAPKTWQIQLNATYWFL